MNTGVQRSATPPPRAPPPRRPSATAPGNVSARGKNALPLIAMAHGSPLSPPPRWPTCTTSRPRSSAMAIRGARYLHRAGALPAGLGRGLERHDPPGAVSARRPACSRCSRPSMASESGGGAADPPPPRWRNTCSRRSGSRTCSRKPPDVIERRRPGRSQHPRIPPASMRGGRHEMRKPFAITLTSALAGEQDRLLAHVAPVYVDRLPPCNTPARPAKTSRAGSSTPSRRLRAAWRHAGASRQPASRSMGRVCYHPARAPATAAKLDEAVGINAVERFLGDEAIRRGWRSRRRPPRAASACWSSAPGPRACRRPPPAPPRPCVTVRGRPMPGGMMRFGIPKYRLPREVLDAEMRASSRMGVAKRLAEGGRPRRPRCRKARFDAAFLAVGAHRQARLHPGGRSARACSMPSRCCAAWMGESPHARRRVVVYGGGNTAIDVARTAKRLGASEAVIVYRRTREKAGARLRGRGGAAGRRDDQVALDHPPGEAGEITVEKMVLDDRRGRSRPASSRRWQADSLVLALGQDVDLAARGRAGLVIQDGVVQVGPNA